MQDLKKYIKSGFAAVVSLHECAGHASGKLVDGVSTHDLGPVYGIIEECRADLVAYYMLGDAAFVKSILPEVEDHDAFLKAMYAEYLTQGTLHQLFRIPAGSATYGGATHFRNRQLNNLYVLERALLTGCVRYVDCEFGPCTEVTDPIAVRQIYAELLREIQRIKSTGDKSAATYLVETYGTYIDPSSLLDAHRRVADLSTASYVAFVAPKFVATGDIERPFVLKQHENFEASQFYLRNS